MLSQSKTKNKIQSKAIIYCRVSSERQKNEGSGLDSQQHRCLEFAKQRGYEVSEIFKDSFSGGGDYHRRPALSDMFSYIDRYPVQNFVVLIDDLSRFARDVKAHFELKKDLKDKGVELECTNFHFEDTPEGELIETLMAAQHQYHRKNNTRQVIQKQTARLQSGYWAFGAKKGYKMVKSPEHGKISIPDTELAPIIKEALEGFASGRFVRRIDVCEFLVENKFWKNQKPEKYIDNFVQIARDPFYAGYISYPSRDIEMINGKHEGIITLETYNKLQKRLDNDIAGKRIRKDLNDDFPLRGMIVCSGCGSHLTGAWSKGRSERHPYYLCQNQGCIYKRKSLKRKDVEDGFEILLKKQKLKPNFEKVLSRVFDCAWQDELSEVKSKEKENLKRVQDLESKIELLSNQAIESKKDSIKRVYENQIEKTVKQLEEIESELPKSIDYNIPYRTALNKSVGLLKSPYKVWISLDPIEQQRLFYFIFDEKLPYDKNEGYRTDKIPCAVRLFEEFVDQNSLDVEMGGIEPPCI